VDENLRAAFAAQVELRGTFVRVTATDASRHEVKALVNEIAFGRRDTNTGEDDEPNRVVQLFDRLPDGRRLELARGDTIAIDDEEDGTWVDWPIEAILSKNRVGWVRVRCTRVERQTASGSRNRTADRYTAGGRYRNR
jgi:hypothetical protein